MLFMFENWKIYLNAKDWACNNLQGSSNIFGDYVSLVIRE
jgi:hypothetical protein